MIIVIRISDPFDDDLFTPSSIVKYMCVHWDIEINVSVSGSAVKQLKDRNSLVLASH